MGGGSVRRVQAPGAGAPCSPDCEAVGGLSAQLLGSVSLSPVRSWMEEVLGLGSRDGVGDPCVR